MVSPLTQPQQQPQPTQQQPTTDYRGTDAAPLVVRTLPSEKTQAETAEEEAEKKDVSAANWWMVRLTAIIGGIGFVQMIVFGIQARRLGETIEKMDAIAKREATENQELTEIARNNAAAAASQATAMAGVRDAIEAQESHMRAQNMVLSNTASAMERSADISARALIASQRPWVFADVKVGGPLQIQQNGDVTIRLDFTMKNVGNSPALVAWPYARAVFGDQDFILTQGAVLSEARQRQGIDLGLTVFQEYPMMASITVALPFSTIKDNAQYKAMKRIAPNIVGAIDYQFPFNNDRGATGFVYLLTYIGDNLAIPLENGDVPPEQLSIKPWIGSASVFRAN